MIELNEESEVYAYASSNHSFVTGECIYFRARMAGRYYFSNSKGLGQFLSELEFRVVVKK